jgi:hypothetical protein
LLLLLLWCCVASGIDMLLDDMAAADPEWSKLMTVPGLLEPWNDLRDKWQVATDEFKVRPSSTLVACQCWRKPQRMFSTWRAAIVATLPCIQPMHCIQPVASSGSAIQPVAST